MPVARIGEIELYYETQGDPGGEPMLLVMGIGMQLTGWDEAFCRLLTDSGFYVVRFDNRDMGLSSRVVAPPPDLTAAMMGDCSSLAYTLDDLAEDATRLLDALGIDKAHVVGASMGAMIAQLLAISYPTRVRTLTSIMGSTGNLKVGQPHPEAIAALMAPGASVDRDGWVERRFALSRTIGSKAFPLSDRQLRAFLERDYDRGAPSHGAMRQLAAVLCAKDRTNALRELRVPALVIHGLDDLMVDVSGGRATAEAIPDAELFLIEEMGHDLPYAKWGEISSAISRNAKRARS